MNCFIKMQGEKESSSNDSTQIKNNGHQYVSKLNICPSAFQVPYYPSVSKPTCSTSSSPNKYEIISASQAENILKISLPSTEGAKSKCPNMSNKNINQLSFSSPSLSTTCTIADTQSQIHNQSLVVKTSSKPSVVQSQSMLTISQSKISTFAKIAPSTEIIPISTLPKIAPKINSPSMVEATSYRFQIISPTMENICSKEVKGRQKVQESHHYITESGFSACHHNKDVGSTLTDIQSQSKEIFLKQDDNFNKTKPIIFSQTDTDSNVKTSAQQIKVIPTQVGTIKVSNVENQDSAIYLLVADDSTTSNITASGKNIINEVSPPSADCLKNIDTSIDQTLEIMNAEGIPIQVNVNDLLATINESKSDIDNDKGVTSSLVSVSSTIINSATADGGSQLNQYYIAHPTAGFSDVPTWALTLRDLALHGDTYSGYVMNESEMDLVLNMYKKETQSIFAIRQTPSPAKDERIETIRLMWKSQYVPYDGIPFVNVGRRATVMECEHGPRKRNNAIKRLIQVYGHKTTMKRIPNLTCPARLFVKKVRKFPQFRVPLEANQKFLRHLQEQSLKLVRNAGYNTGEVRLYMQLPLPSAHRYHHIGNTVDAFERELEENKEFVLEEIAVDNRILTKIQELVRQGFTNPFIVRAAMKDFVDNKLEMEDDEERPSKHDKTFYPPMIEIQNIIQQTKVAINNGILTPLSPPGEPPVPVKLKRKKMAADVNIPGMNDVPDMSTEPKLKASRKSLKPSKYNLTALEALENLTANATNDTLVTPESNDNSIEKNLPPSSESETLSISISENNLENFSVNNFSYDQLQQLAKIGLLALNNVSKDDENALSKVDNNLPNGTDICSEANIQNTDPNISDTVENTNDISNQLADENQMIGLVVENNLNHVTLDTATT